MTDVIRSPHNPLLKRIRSLGNRKARYAERAFVLEGMRAISGAIDAGAVPEIVLVTDDAGPSLVALATRFPFRTIARACFDPLMDTDTPQGIAAVFPLPASGLPSVSQPLIVLLDAISDPGNLGTIIRSAAAAGADGVILGPGCVDPYNPKSIRAAMGAIFAIPVVSWTTGLETWLRQACPQRWLAAGDGERSYDDPLWQGGVAMIIGSEAHGVSDWGRGLATGSVSIPLHRTIESLNAAIAASILLFEARKQRQASPGL